ncbi:MAG: acyl-CoA thioesterase [Halochromatium sp.]
MTAANIEHRFRVALHDTDAAGVLFFAHLFRHAHDAYEAMMARIGWPLDGLIRERQLGLPLVHAEADYRRPMRHGDQVAVRVERAGLTERDFSLAYGFFIREFEVATALSVHAAIDPWLGKRQLLPPELVHALAALPARAEPGV